MKVQVEELSPIERKLSFEIEPERVAKEVDQAYKQLSQRVNMPGFRKGKIPRRLLEQHYSKAVELDVADRVRQKAFLEALEKHDIPVVSSPNFNDAPFKLGEQYNFEARVEVRPKVVPQDYAGLAFARKESAIQDAQVEERLEQMRNQHATLLDVTDRDTAQMGDWVQVAIESENADGSKMDEASTDNVTVEVAPGEVTQGKFGILEGVKVGETKAFDHTFPADYFRPELQGKTTHLKVTLNALKKQVTPELNDEFAKDMDSTDLNDLRQKVKTQLVTTERSQFEVQEREEILKLLIEKNPIEIPKSMIDRAADNMLRGALRQMMSQGMNAENLDWGSLLERTRPRAQDEIRAALLLEAIADKENIQVTDEETEKKLESLAASQGMTLSQLKKQFREPSAQESLKFQVREEKTIEFLKSQARKP